MRKFTLAALALLLSVCLSGCGLMEDAFKTGFIIALILAAIIGLLIWILHFTYKQLVKRGIWIPGEDGFKGVRD